MLSGFCGCEGVGDDDGDGGNGGGVCSCGRVFLGGDIVGVALVVTAFVSLAVVIAVGEFF